MKSQKISTVLLAAAVFALVTSCGGIRLTTKGALPKELTGTYTAILYGCNHMDDLETVAILVKEGGPYTFEPFAPAFNYRVIKGVPSAGALNLAERFVACHTAFKRPQIASILGSNGEVLAYEVRPIYYSFAFGVDDPLFVDYMLKGEKVVVTIRLLPSVENMLRSGSGAGGRER